MEHLKSGTTKERWEYAIQDKAFDFIRDKKLMKTTGEHFLNVLASRITVDFIQVEMCQ